MARWVVLQSWQNYLLATRNLNPTRKHILVDNVTGALGFYSKLNMNHLLQRRMALTI